MSSQLPFSLPDIGPAEVAEVTEALLSGWITTGPRCKAFEREFAARLGARHGIAINSCTAAMHIALEAIGVAPGDEVLVPTMTFAATGEVVRYLGAKPVLVDIDESDHNLDVRLLERALTPRTKAVIPVHFAGQACDMAPILQFARAKKLAVVEDAAHAFPASYGGAQVGCLGDITCFSFYATKTITTAEGGMALTDNEQWADRMRVMSLHGISKDAWKRYTAAGSWFYEIIAPGFKYNMTDVAAAMGLVQLRRADEMLERRRQIALAYTQAFSDHEALQLLTVRSFADHAWHLFVIKLQPEALTVDRSEFIDALRTAGIGCSVHFIPLHLHPYYRETFGYEPRDFPIALDCYERSISLPIYSKMSDGDVQRVIGAVTDLLAKYRR